MDVGSEFPTWNFFIQELDKYSKDIEVSYSVGLSRPIENTDHDDFAVKLDTKFKYSYARMVCSHGNQDKHNRWKRKPPNQKGSRSCCLSSILVCLNKERTGLVIVAANLDHNHNALNKGLTAGTQLKGEERRMASVLIRGGVPLHRVQVFVSNFQERNVDCQSGSDSSGLDSMKGSENQLLFRLDQLMADDPSCVIEFIDFHLIPDVIYFQTHEMKTRVEQMECVANSCIQLITCRYLNGKFSIITIVAVNGDMGQRILAQCLTSRHKDSMVRNVVETFVKHNQGLCNNVKGFIVNCDKNDAEFVRLFFPQAHIAWSKEFILERFENDVQRFSIDDEHNLISTFKKLIMSSTVIDYDSTMNFFLDVQNSDFSNNFLTQWDSCREMWVHYMMDDLDVLSHQDAGIEAKIVHDLHQYIQSECEFSEIIGSLILMDKTEEIGNGDTSKTEMLKLNPWNSFYRSLCLPEAAEAVICQIAISGNSSYNIHKAGSSGIVYIQRVDFEEKFRLNVQGTSCTCEHFTNTELPCEHIFSWRSTYDLNMCDESLIPLKWQVLGESVTLDSLAQSLSQGYVPSSAHHDERLKALQIVLKDILTSCASHSYEDMGKDIILLKQVSDVLKHGNAESKSKCFEYTQTDIASDKSLSAIAESSVPLPKKRGRKSKKEKEILAAKEVMKVSSEKSVKNKPAFERRHNLRTNIKHKFVTRESSAMHETKETSSDSTLKTIMSPITNSDSIDGTSLDILPLESDKKAPDFQVSWSKENELGSDDVPKVGSVSLSDKDDFVHSQTKGLKRAKPNYNITYYNDRKYKIIKSNEENDYSSNESDGFDGVEYLTKKRLVEDNEFDREEESESSSSKQGRLGQDLSKFLEGMSVESLQELMQGISMLDHFDERSQNDEEAENNQLIYPVDFVINACHGDKENLDFIIRNLEKQISDYNKFAYKVAASLILTAFNTGAEVSEIRESINDWPSHLPPLSTSPDDDVGLPLEADQVLTVCGYKLDRSDMETLNSHSKLSPRVIHAYLEVLAQRHNGKMFVIPFDVIQHWRNETYGEMLFKKVHFKTFDYLMLPIHCGAEFSGDEALEDGEMVSPQWMVLVADVHNKTVGMLNPRTEDKYIIAANGYMLQWRRYMQIRSVLTGEMLSAWTTQVLHCNKQTMNHTSGALAVMNVEAVICSVPPCVMTEAHITHFVHYVGVTLRDTDRETTVLCVGGLQCQEMAAQDTDWLQCQNCRAWWHRACCGCEGAGMVGGEHKTFYCSPCKQRIEAVKISVGVLGDGAENEGREEDGCGEEEEEEGEFERGGRRYDDDNEEVEMERGGDEEDEKEEIEESVAIQGSIHL